MSGCIPWQNSSVVAIFNVRSVVKLVIFVGQKQKKTKHVNYDIVLQQLLYTDG